MDLYGDVPVPFFQGGPSGPVASATVIQGGLPVIVIDPGVVEGTILLRWACIAVPCEDQWGREGPVLGAIGDFSCGGGGGERPPPPKFNPFCLKKKYKSYASHWRNWFN